MQICLSFLASKLSAVGAESTLPRVKEDCEPSNIWYLAEVEFCLHSADLYNHAVSTFLLYSKVSQTVLHVGLQTLACWSQRSICALTEQIAQERTFPRTSQRRDLP